MEGMTPEDLDMAIEHDRARRAVEKVQDEIQRAEGREASYAKSSASVCAEVALICARAALANVRADSQAGEKPARKVKKEEVEWFLNMAEKALKLARSADSLGDLPAARMGCDRPTAG